MTHRRPLVTLFLLAFCPIAVSCGEDKTPSFESTFGSASVETEAVNDGPADTDAESTETPTTTSEEATSATEATPDDPADPAHPPPPAPVLPSDLSLSLTEIVEVDRPIDMATRAGSDHIFIATKGGQVVEVDPASKQVVQELINISDLIDDAFESGLLGIDFSPDGDTFFMHYSDLDHNNNVVALAMDGDSIAVGTGRTLLFVEQPADNHNGGDLAFGPDGYLYVALGDGGGGGDPFNNGQDPSTLLATILRIDPAGDPYSIPADNPFVSGGGAEEVFLYGVRNPWRISFDRATGDLWIADVGQDAVEEVNVAYVTEGGGLGANLGWNDVEGTSPFASPGPPAGDNYLAPIFEYPRSEGCSVTGGYIYRGEAIPDLQGNYVFGDYCTGELWGITTSQDDGLVGRFDLNLRPPGDGLVSFGEGPDGELYVLTFPETVYRIDAG